MHALRKKNEKKSAQKNLYTSQLGNIEEKIKRKKYICDILNRKKAVRVAELSKQLGITEATVRKDLDELQGEKKLRRTHGGAIPFYSAAVNYMMSDLLIVHIEEKQSIAKEAYKFIDDNDTVMCDGSTTVLELAKLLVKGEKKGLTILTNSVNLVNLLKGCKDITLIQIGGEFRSHNNSTMGKISERTIRDLRVDKSFIGLNGVALGYGYSVTNFDDAAVKREMLKAAKQSFVLADNSKFGDSYLAKVADDEGEVDFLITDKKNETFDYVAMEDKVQIVYADSGI